VAREVIIIPGPQEAEQLSKRMELQETFDRNSACDLLRLLLCQAMADGISKVVIGVDAATGRSYMSYGRRDTTGRFECWDMVAPTTEMFPFLLQCVLSATELEPSMPLRGSASARREDESLRIAVTVAVPDSFELQWG
jgi:hypothetical protein